MFVCLGKIFINVKNPVLVDLSRFKIRVFLKQLVQRDEFVG